MPSHVVLIQKPSIDFQTFLATTLKALGYNPSKSVDGSSIDHSESERFLSCLAAMQDKDAPVGLPPRLLSHVSFSVLIIVEQLDLTEILEAAGEMVFVTAETVMRGIDIAVITGTLKQWKDAVTHASGRSPACQDCYGKVLSTFKAVGLDVWDGIEVRDNQGTLRLEFKRK